MFLELYLVFWSMRTCHIIHRCRNVDGNSRIVPFFYKVLRDYLFLSKSLYIYGVSFVGKENIYLDLQHCHNN
uniref:Uncharacterized protein n=1 Tax=Rhizophora mucronata TaxID=61149 RepID=A0A2P2J2P6_RHIMU